MKFKYIAHDAQKEDVISVSIRLINTIQGVEVHATSVYGDTRILTISPDGIVMARVHAQDATKNGFNVISRDGYSEIDICRRNK